MSTVHSVENCPWKTAKPTVRGRISKELVTIRGQRKLFQPAKKVKVPKVA